MPKPLQPNEYYSTCSKCWKKFKVQDWKVGEELNTCFTCLVAIHAYKDMVKKMKKDANPQ